jgi:hypothetical protein
MIKILAKRVRIIYEVFSLDQNSRKFKKYLCQFSEIKKTKSDSVIMIEFEQSPENVIGLSMFLPILLEKIESNLVAYQVTQHKGLPRLIKKVQYRFSTTSRLIGNKLILISFNDSDKNMKYEEHWRKIQSPEALETFEYLGIRIGDLVYDEYLVKFNTHTLDLADLDLKKTFIKAMASLDWWNEFISNKSVGAVVASHDVYLYGIPVRLAISRGIPVFLVSTSEVIRLNQIYPRVGADIPLYPDIFLKQEKNFRIDGVNIAKEKIHNRINGIGPSDLNYFPLVAFGEVQNEKKYLKVSNRRKILIAVHDFYDSPHCGQIHFYPDFYLWLVKLSEIANETDYDWYIKTHPYLRGRGREILANFVLNNSKFELLPPEVTHNELISEGIDLALTVYGTIATEYPLLGVRVLNASRCNPHASYQFSVTPESRDQYEFYLKNIDFIPPVGNTKQIYEYYFMRHLLPLRNWVFRDDLRYKKETGFGFNPMTRKIYNYFLTTDNLVPVKEIQFALRNFLESSSYQLGRSHFKIDVNTSIDNV